MLRRECWKEKVERSRRSLYIDELEIEQVLWKAARWEIIMIVVIHEHEEVEGVEEVEEMGEMLEERYYLSCPRAKTKKHNNS